MRGVFEAPAGAQAPADRTSKRRKLEETLEGGDEGGAFEDGFEA